jgi:hypothetical protein
LRSIDEVVASATHPKPVVRADSAIAWVSLLLEHVTAPTDPPATGIDPLEARPGDELGEGLVVHAILGSGASGRGLLVERSDGQYALKVSRDDDAATRLRDEAAVLARIRSDRVVAVEQRLELHGRDCLLLTYGGETLAAVLARDGPVSLDYAQRWGEDLLLALGDPRGPRHPAP